MAKSMIVSILFSTMFLLGMMVCLICNIAITGSLTWSHIPVCSIVFAWLVSFPSIVLGKRGLVASLLSLSIFIFPYLFLLGLFTGVKEVFSVGAAVAAAAIVFLWIIAAAFTRIGKTRKCVALGVSFLLAIPFVIIVNVMLNKMVGSPVFDIWDLLSIFVLLLSALVSFVCDYAKRRAR